MIMFKLSQRLVLNINILWFFYSILILISMEVSWDKVLRQDGWYRIYEDEEDDYDGQGGHYTYFIEHPDGPYTKNEIDGLYLNDLKECKIFMHKYGTLYNLPYWFYNKNSQPYTIIGILIHFCFICSVPYISYFAGKPKYTKN